MAALIKQFSVLCMIVLAIILSSSATLSCEASTTPAKNCIVADCNPCLLEIAPDHIYSMTFQNKKLPNDERTVEALHIRKEDKPGWEQILTIHAMLPVDEAEKVFWGISDVNFDGYNDLFFATSRGVANTYADYWLFIPSDEKFSYLGNYPIFKVDADKQSLSTYEKGGHGGMIFTANRYRFIDGALTLVESEKQETTQETGIYKNSIYRIKDGRLQLIESRKIR